MRNYKCGVKKIAGLIMALLMITNSFLTAFAEDSFRVAKIYSLSGDVRVLRAGGEKSFAAFAEMSLTQGDRIITGRDGRATLYIDDDKEVVIAENTQVNLSELQGSIEGQNDQTGLSLFVGKLWTDIKNKLNIRSKFEIKTPTAVMGVRGTKFYVNSSGGETDVAVLEGTVAATAYRLESRPGEREGQREIEVLLRPNEQVRLNESVQTREGVEIRPVTQQSLELFVLQEILKNPAGIEPNLLRDIQQVIEQKQAEQQRQQEQQKNGQDGQEQSGGESALQIRYLNDPAGNSAVYGGEDDTHTPVPSDGDEEPGGDEGDGQPPSPTAAVNYFDAFYINGVMTFNGCFDREAVDRIELAVRNHGEEIFTIQDNYTDGEMTVDSAESGCTATGDNHTDEHNRYARYRESDMSAYMSADGGHTYELKTYKDDVLVHTYTGPVIVLRDVDVLLKDGALEVTGNVYGADEFKIRVERGGHSYSADGFPAALWETPVDNRLSHVDEGILGTLEAGAYECVIYFKDGNVEASYYGIVIGYVYVSPDGEIAAVKKYPTYPGDVMD